ncbi:MAG: CAP domain-containing protein [Candidatus Vogelbacteria bacterium]|nr:CAP domain-containing protein [Candidatus Vogelbacteria bacterium]
MDLRRKLKNFFIPSLQNQLRPYSLRFATLAVVVILSIAIEVLFYSYVNVAFKRNNLLGNIISSIQSTVAEVLPQVILEQTNLARSRAGEPPLAANVNLTAAARLKAEDMAQKSYFSHQSPDGSMAWDFMQRANYRYSYAGENLAVNFFDANDVVNAWMNSPSHRTNILSHDYREIGIAATRGVYDGKETVFVVQLFGSPSVPEVMSKNFAAATTSVARALAVKPASPVRVRPRPSFTNTNSKTATSSVASSTTIAVASSTLVIGTATAPAIVTVSASLPPVTAVSFGQRYLVSPRHMARDAYFALLIYMLLALLIPMYMIYHNHASADRGLRFREIFILFRQPITSALVTFICVSAVMGLNYFWSKQGTNIYQAAIGVNIINATDLLKK